MLRPMTVAPTLASDSSTTRELSFASPPSRAVHRAPDGERKHPLVQSHAADAERIVDALVRPATKPSSDIEMVKRSLDTCTSSDPQELQADDARMQTTQKMWSLQMERASTLCRSTSSERAPSRAALGMMRTIASPMGALLRKQASRPRANVALGLHDLKGRE
jgi:hypothetical protein